MKNRHMLGAGVIAVVLFAFALYLVPYRAVAPTTIPATPTTLPASKYTESTAYYTLAVNYPTTTPLAASANQAAITAMKAYVAGEIASFKEQGNFAHLTKNDVQMMGYDKGRQESLQILYLEGSGPQTISYIFTEYLDTMGAHPNTFFKTFTFDKTTGKLLSLSDVFTGAYLAKLSSSASAAITENMGADAVPDMIAAGTKPDVANFANWFFDNADFVVLFPPYAVAPYSSGPQTARIPVVQLDSVLQAKYRQ